MPTKHNFSHRQPTRQKTNSFDFTEGKPCCPLLTKCGQMSFLLSVLIAASSISFWPITIANGRQYGGCLASNANDQAEISLRSVTESDRGNESIAISHFNHRRNIFFRISTSKCATHLYLLNIFTQISESVDT